MSKETLEWLNENTLIGFTDKRGTAWHYRAGADNHYTGAVPVEDVRKRLFDWDAVQVPEQWEHNGTVYVSDTDSVVIRSDTGAKLGTFRNGYQPHQYGEWLISNVADILDDNLQIGSAGLLKGGAVAWVSVEVPDTITTPEGVQFRPNLIACTSFDGSLATTYKRCVKNVVCDNTMAGALAEQGQQFRVKHSRKSLGRLTDAREALAIVHTISADFAAEVKELCNTSFSESKFEELLDVVAEMPEVPKDGENSRGYTMAENKRGTLWNLWSSDERVVPWRGTAYGAWQTLNTYQTHMSIVRNVLREERNMLNTVDGSVEKSDREALANIRSLVLA